MRNAQIDLTSLNNPSFMRLTSTSKFVLKLLAGTVLLAALVLYIAYYHPQLAYILYGALMLFIMGFIVYVNVGPIASFLG